MTHYPSLLLDVDRVQFGLAITLNLATLLPSPGGQAPHDCQQILAEAHGTRPNLSEQPLVDSEITWYTDGSSYLLDGERKAGTAMVDGKQFIWASASPPGTSAQRAELITLTQSLQLEKVKDLMSILIADMHLLQPMSMGKYIGCEVS